MQQQEIYLPLLSRLWIIPCTTGSIVFLVLQFVVIYDHLILCSPSCNSLCFTRWTWIPNIIESTMSSTLVFFQASQVMFKNRESCHIGCLYTTIFIGTITGIASFLNLLTDWAGYCEDVFGVKLPRTFWPEWLVCVPMLYYIVLATDNTQIFPFQAKFVVLSMTCAFILGFCLQFTNSYIFSVFLLSLSIAMFTSASLLLYYITIYADGQSRPQCESTQRNEYTICLRKMQRKLSICILCITSLFPLVYLMSLFRIINQDTTYVLFISLNILSKFLFISNANNAYINIDTEYLKIKIASEISPLHSSTIENNTRKLFLRYIMHEVRVPLNSISMGLGYLEESSIIDDDAQEALLMMSSASEYMKQALDEVLNLQTIEEGTMILNFAPFNIHSVIRKARASVVNILKEKQILLDIRIEPAVPKCVIGDASRIEIVISNILNNALKFSEVQSIVEISITSDNLEKNIKGIYNNIRNNTTFDSTGKPILIQTSKLTSTITFTIIDHGPGIPPENLPNLFVPFSQIYPHELHCRGSSGIGLLMCKQIVELHGGSISCQSTVGVGSTFTITIPFKLCDDDFQCEQSEYKSSYNTRLHRNKNKINISDDRTTNFDQFLYKIDDEVPRVAERIELRSTLNTDKNLYFYPRKVHTNIDSNNNNDIKNNIENKLFSNKASAKNDSLIELDISECIADFDDNSGDNYMKRMSQPPNLTNKSTTVHDLCRVICDQNIKRQVSDDNFSLTLRKKVNISTYTVMPLAGSSAKVDSDDLTPGGNTGVLTDINDNPNKLFHVLVTDDVSSSRKLLAMLLGKRGITSTMASNGREAVELVQHTIESYDMIFMDNSMPIMNGVDATRAIRAAGYPNLIIGVTGNAMADDVREFIAAGVDSVILKPLSVHQLQQIMDYISVYGKSHIVDRKIAFNKDYWEYLDV